MTFTSTLWRPAQWLAVSLLLTSSALAQTPAKPRPVAAPPAEQAVHYRNGKALLDQGKYQLALKELEPLAQRPARFAQAADAAYLSAVAAARLKQWPEAEQLLNLLRTEYPNYPNLPEALFLQSQVSFEQEDYDNAFKTLALLPANQLGPEREAMKVNYLPRIRDRSTWLRLLRRYPNDATLGRAYADRLITGGVYTDADQPILDELIDKLDLNRARYTPPPRPVKRSSYNVAVLLPFELSDPGGPSQRKNQFVTDLYAGLRLAQDSLQRAGRSVQLFAYDTSADTLVLKQVLAQPELAGMDLLIGPVYKSGARLLARYAREHQIVCVNPLSEDGDLVLDNSWHYLFGASAATQGRIAAEFAFRAFGPSRPGIVLHEETKGDAAFANAYKAAYEAQGGKIAVVRSFSADTNESLSKAFAGLDLPGASHIVVASDNRRLGPYTLNVLQTPPAAKRPVLVCPGSWLDNPRLDVWDLNTISAYFFMPKYYNERGAGYRRFRQLYLQRQRLPPSLYANQGFELLLYFGAALHQYGPALQAGLAGAPPVQGAIFEGQSYEGGAHDNQVVPIIKLNNLEAQVLR
ncbi:ABC transporter substrate-binding protein [Hymenobacter sp. BT664]|uniref:ABC transporter substrate-binding protein n=1 Tax=Hymenobacter montanus TaxID=2771359 RepID=A0A927GJ59_9BACT|nr:ABC transporter substrate-binding protein [Hymenobacter montanus]MBD2768070.1 ABC transporter substrate-binding protein [Hymenobacter montanus]